jgi:hypothetical protein
VIGLSHDRLSTPAWLLDGFLRRRSGILVLDGRRLAFSTPDAPVFDVPLTSVTGIRFPWYYFGGGVILKAGDHPYRLSFVEPGDQGDVAGGRQAGRMWKHAFIAAGLLQRTTSDV